MAVIPKILVFAGSIRSGAYSGRTADVAQKELAMQGAEVTRLSLADYPLPILDQDRQLVGIVSLGDISVRSDEKTAAAEALEGISEPATPKR